MDTPDLPGPHIRSAFAALDELIALAANPDTADQVCAERVLIGTLLARAMLLASFVKEREAGRVHRIGAGR